MKTTYKYKMWGFVKKNKKGNSLATLEGYPRTTWLCDTKAVAEQAQMSDEEVVRVTVSYTVER